MVQDEEEFKRQRTAFRDTVAENDARLWFIARMADATVEFPQQHLATLAKFRRLSLDPNYVPASDVDQTELQAATMAAARFIGDRKPESIRAFADMQAGRQRSSLLTSRIVWLIVALVAGLAVHAFNSYLVKQAKAMEDAVAAFEAGELALATPTESVRTTLSRLCSAVLNYRSAADLVPKLLLPETVGEPAGGAPGEAGAGASHPPRSEEAKLLPERERSETCDLVLRRDSIPEPLTAQEAADAKIRSDHLLEIEWFRAEAQSAKIADFNRTPTLHRVRGWTDILGGIVVPLFFATLGALAAAVRTADQRVRELTFTPVDNRGLFAKTILGIAAGASVGIVFARSQDVADEAGLTLIGLAFIVGYSVDLFFSVLDSVKLGLGVKPGK